MAKQVILPKLGLTMQRAVISEWLRAEGDSVKTGDVLCTIETDKITTEVESTETGILLKILVPADEEADILTPICTIGEADEEEPEVSAEHERTDESAAVSENESADAGENPPETAPILHDQARNRILISPFARRLASENGVDFSALTGSGPEGRIVKADVLAASFEKNGAKKSDPLSPMRRAIAGRMVESKQTIPHVYFRCEVDALALGEQKRRLSEEFTEKYGRKLTYNDLLLKAAAIVLAEFPVFRGRVQGESVTYADGIHLGFAVGLDDGLVVPVIRNADRLSLREMSDAARELARRARGHSLGLGDLENGIFTLSNLGMYAVDSFDAVINPPQSGILSVGRIVEKVVPVAGGFGIRPRITLGLSVDHRLIDGAVAGAFLTRLKETIENSEEYLL